MLDSMLTKEMPPSAARYKAKSGALAEAEAVAPQFLSVLSPLLAQKNGPDTAPEEKDLIPIRGLDSLSTEDWLKTRSQTLRKLDARLRKRKD